MSSSTTNIGLTKPAMTDTWGNIIPGIAASMDKVDQQIGILSGNLGGHGINVMYPPAPLVAAKGDGTTDDSAAINACIAHNSSYLTVYIPDGTYRLSSPITINRQNLMLVGNGRATTLYPDAGVAAIQIGTANGVSQTRIENLRIYGQTNATGGILFGANVVSFTTLHGLSIENFQATGSYGIQLNQVQELDIFNCYMYQNYDHISLPNTAGNYCTSTHIHGMAGYLGHAGHLAINLAIPVAGFTVSEIVIEGNSAGGIAASGKGTEINIERCHIESNGSPNTIYVAGTSAGNAKLNLKDCFFYGNTAPILRLAYIANSIISGNDGLIGSGNIVTDATCDLHFEFNRAEDIAQNQDAISIYEGLAGTISYIDTDTSGRRIVRMNGVKNFSAAAAPTTGTWKVGDYCKNNAPAVGTPKGWYCTVAGTPGTWVSEGNL